MSKPIAIALLVGGIILLVFGFNASESVGSEVSETFTGTPTNKSIWLLVLGALLAVAGGIGLARRRA